MAIPNPNPNIKDGVVVDNKTWSSSKIAEGLNNAGVTVGTDGSFDEEHFELLKSVTISESGVSSYDAPNINCKHVFVVFSFTAAVNSAISCYLRAKTDSSPDSWINTGAYTRLPSMTIDSDYIATLECDCSKGLMKGEAFLSAASSYGSIMKTNNSSIFSNILSKKIIDLQIMSSVEFPVGSTIKVYGY